MRVLLATGPKLEALGAYVRTLPCQVVFTASQREDVGEYLQGLGAEEVPDVLLAAESLPGNPPGISFATAIRRYWPDVRVIWLAREINDEARRELENAGVAVVAGQISGRQIAALIGVSETALDQVEGEEMRLAHHQPSALGDVPAASGGATRVEPAPSLPVEAVSLQPENGTTVESDNSGPARSQVVAVWSPKSEGATTTALHIAKMLSQSKPTVLLDLNLKRPQLASFFRDGESAADFSNHSLDLLWPNLDGGTLTAELLQETVWKGKEKNAPSVLGGIRRREYFSGYSLRPVVELIRMAQGAYGHVVIDVSADLDNAGAEAAFALADVILVVMKPTWFTLEAYTEARRIQSEVEPDPDTHLKPDVTRHRILLIKDAQAPYTAADVSRFCSVPVIGTLPYVPEMDRALSLGECLSGSTKAASEYLRVLQGLTF